MVFLHRTTEENWIKIKQEGILWGKNQCWSEGIGWHDNPRRYTYLSGGDWGDSYGNVLLEVEYIPKGDKVNDNCNLEPADMLKMLAGDILVDQFSVFVPISISHIRRIKSIMKENQPKSGAQKLVRK